MKQFEWQNKSKSNQPTKYIDIVCNLRERLRKRQQATSKVILSDETHTHTRTRKKNRDKMEYNHVQRMKIVFKIKIYHETKLLICNEFVVVESIVCTPNSERSTLE